MKLFVQHFWKILFLVTGGAAVWIGAIFATKVLEYYQLSHSVTGISIRWGVVSYANEKNYIYAEYQYSVGSESYVARYLFPKALKDKQAAETILEDKKAETVQVWYGKPHVSSLERIFPINDLMRLVIILGIMIYFLLLKNYLQNLESNLAS